MSLHLESLILHYMHTAKPFKLPPTLRELAKYTKSHPVQVHKAIEELVRKRKLFRPRPQGTSRNIALRNGKR
jgi:hypothetical protein